MAIEKTIQKIGKSLYKNSIWFRIIIVLSILFCLVVIYNNNKIKREGFGFDKKFDTKSNNSIYDNFYVSVYDDLVYDTVKNEYEIGQIHKHAKLTSKSIILDVGSGTGHHVDKLNKIGRCIGVDKSKEMVKKSKENYPGINVSQGDVLNSMLFHPNEFTHITCFYFTIYYIENKLLFFQNCMRWLKPGGKLVIHMVDRSKFDPIVPAGDPFVIVSPQKFAKTRIMTSEVVFNNFNYKSEFNPERKQNDYPNDVVMFKETFKDKKNGNVRQNLHKLYMPIQKKILSQAKSAGFIVVERIEMINCQYEHQYLYILQKPN